MCEKCRRNRCCKRDPCCNPCDPCDPCPPKVLCCKGDKGDQGPPGPKGTALGYAEFINSDDDETQTNIAVPTGNAFTIDTEVVNSIGSGITKTAGNGGTVFRLTFAGAYEIDYELSPLVTATGGSVDLALGPTIGTMVIDPTTIAGAATIGTWVHGRAIVKITTPTYVMVTPDPTSTPLSVGPAGLPTANRVIRLTIVQISST